MRPLTDGRGRTISLPSRPERIVSLVPSTTETLFDLGCAERVVGRTRYCVRPADGLGDIAKVGGTKDVDPDRVAELRPDLILANCEENTREILDALEPIARVWAAFPRDVDGALDDLSAVGALVGEPERARALRHHIACARADLQRAAAGRRFRYAYLIWREPYMSVNDDTFIAAMLAEAGGINVFAGHADRFPTLTPGDLRRLDPDTVLLSSEPFPFRARHRDELVEHTGIEADRVRFIDGEHASWHGSRMRHAFRAFAHAAAHGFERAPISRSHRPR